MKQFIYHNHDSNFKFISSNTFKDERGFLFESYKKEQIMLKFGDHFEFIQENFVSSKKDVFRGLHYQEEPFAQSKLLMVLKGEIVDIILDLRKNSKTFLKWEAVVVSEKDRKLICIPKGFAHGYLVLSNKAEIIYKLDNKYSQEHERFINIKNDKIKPNIYETLKKEFKFNKLVMSNKDKSSLDSFENLIN